MSIVQTANKSDRTRTKFVLVVAEPCSNITGHTHPAGEQGTTLSTCESTNFHGAFSNPGQMISFKLSSY